MPALLIRFFFILICFCSIQTVFAQTYKQWMKSGMNAYEEKDYFLAINRFSQATELDPQDVEANYFLGKSAYQLKDYKKAQKSLSKAASRGGARQFSDLPVLLSELYILDGNQKKAERTLTSWLKKKSSTSPILRHKAETLLRSISEEAKFKKVDDDYSIKHLDRPINSSYSDLAAKQSDVEIIFTSNRFLNKSKKEKRYVPAIYQFEDERALRIRFEKPFENLNIANPSVTSNGQLLVFTVCKNADADQCQLYYSRKLDEKKWAVPTKLDEQLNPENSSNTQPQILETETGFTLYFSSNRSGGQGGYDIWKAELSNDFKTLNIENVSTSINTPLDEVTPFYHAQENTLYFSSNGHPGQGGFDVFKSDFNKAAIFSKNLRAPINSKYDDVHFWLHQNDTTGFLSSNRKEAAQLSGSVCCYDIFSITRKKIILLLPEEPLEDTIPIAVLEPEPPVEVKPEPKPIIPKPPTPQPQPPQQATRAELEQLIPLTVYFHNDEPDSNSLRVRTALTYAETYQPYSQLRNTYFNQNPKQTDQLENFFINQVDYGFEQLDLFIDILLQRLQAGDQVTIVIKGYTSPRATDAYNIALAKRRISSLRNHITTFNNGSFASFLSSRQLQIREAPLGETTVPEGVNDAYNNPRESIYSVEASQERRVEIIRLEFNQE